MDEELFWYRTASLDPSKPGIAYRRSIHEMQLRKRGYLKEIVRGPSWITELTERGTYLLSVLTNTERASLVVEHKWDTFYWLVIEALTLKELPEFVTSPNWLIQKLATDSLRKKLELPPIDRGSGSSSSVSAFGSPSIAESIIMEWKHNPSVAGEIIFRFVKVCQL